MPKPALDLLDSMLELDPSRRITAEHTLSSVWLRDVVPDSISPPKYVMHSLVLSCRLSVLYKVENGLPSRSLVVGINVLFTCDHLRYCTDTGFTVRRISAGLYF